MKKISETKDNIIISFNKEELRFIAQRWLHRICTSNQLEYAKKEEKVKCRELYKMLGWN